jgi:hypothetical protein
VFLRLIAVSILGIWAVLLMLGKGGFTHLLLLNGIGVAVVALMIELRKRQRAPD